MTECSTFVWGGKRYTINRPAAKPAARISQKHFEKIPLGSIATLRVDQDGGGAAFVQASKLCTRYAEKRLDMLGVDFALTDIEAEILKLERIGKNPYAHTRYRSRPPRPLHGLALWRWVAARASVSLRAQDVEFLLKRASGKLEREALCSAN